MKNIWDWNDVLVKKAWDGTFTKDTVSAQF
jgi:hypothetical protein